MHEMRYGSGAMYAVVVESPELYGEALKVAEAEAGISGKSLSAPAVVSFKKVLDISTEAGAEAGAETIGLTFKDLMATKGPSLENYLVPNMVGDIAKHFGYDGILATSVKDPNFTNIISLLEF